MSAEPTMAPLPPGRPKAIPDAWRSVSTGEQGILNRPDASGIFSINLIASVAPEAGNEVDPSSFVIPDSSRGATVAFP